MRLPCDAGHNVSGRTVETPDELVAALRAQAAGTIRVRGELAGLPPLHLQPGAVLLGDGPAMLRFAPGANGLLLSSDNTVDGIELAVTPDRQAICNDTGSRSLGRIALTRLKVTGNIRLLAAGQVESGHIEAHDIHLVAADARGFGQRPNGFGVEVMAGVFTVWNQQTDPGCRLTANLTAISAGLEGAPVRGGGIFVAGTPDGGSLMIRRLETGEIHSHGGIPPGTPGLISAGVFALQGAWVDIVRNKGSVTTYGPNDMVLDNWGSVAEWHADGKITSYGPSGIGFVNFGDLGTLRVNGVIETFARGARGFNVYAGSVRDAEFERIITRADGAVGIQISRPVGRIAVRNGLETNGGVGDSLVKGVVMQLPATALSVKRGGSACEIAVSGGLMSHGDGIATLDLQGPVGTFSVTGSLGPPDRGSSAS